MPKRPTGPLTDAERKQLKELEAIMEISMWHGGKPSPNPRPLGEVIEDLPEGYWEDLLAGKPKPRGMPKTPPPAPRRQRKRDGTTDVYLLYDADGVLLYVGISLSVAQRLGTHRQEKPWWGDVARIDIVHCETRAGALRHEAQLIGSLKPAHNIAGQPRR